MQNSAGAAPERKLVLTYNLPIGIVYYTRETRIITAYYYYYIAVRGKKQRDVKLKIKRVFTVL